MANSNSKSTKKIVPRKAGAKPLVASITQAVARPALPGSDQSAPPATDLAEMAPVAASLQPVAEPVSDLAVDAEPSPFVADEGVIGMPVFAVDKSEAGVNTELVQDLHQLPPQLAAPAAGVDDSPTPAAEPVASPPPTPLAAEMNLPLSAEELMMKQIEEDEASGEDDDESEERATEANPAGDFTASTAERVASSTADMILKTFGLLSNEFIIDLTSINEEEIAESVADKQMPLEVLRDARAINKLNAKELPFKKDYRDMLKPHLQRFCAVSGIENLSPTTMLLAVFALVLGMMFLDTRKRQAERDKFMRKIMKKYGMEAEVVDSTTPPLA